MLFVQGAQVVEERRPGKGRQGRRQGVGCSEDDLKIQRVGRGSGRGGTRPGACWKETFIFIELIFEKMEPSFVNISGARVLLGDSSPMRIL